MAKSVQIMLTAAEQQTHCYHLCQRKVYTNQAITALEPFKINYLSNEQSPGFDNKIFKSNRLELIFTGESWLAGKNRRVTCHKSDDGFMIDVANTCRFQVKNDGSLIQQLEYSEFSVDGLEQILLGPPLMLAFALTDLFGLHASAVEINNKAVLFLGKSGSGKSTLARWLQDRVDFKRIADDISILQCKMENHQLLPTFPQLKLTPKSQRINYPATNIGAIILLNRKKEGKVKLQQYATLESMQTLLNNSVAAQLFGKSLAKVYLNFMFQLATNIPTYQLIYPDGEQNIPMVAKQLERQIN